MFLQQPLAQFWPGATCGLAENSHACAES